MGEVEREFKSTGIAHRSSNHLPTLPRHPCEWETCGLGERLQNVPLGPAGGGPQAWGSGVCFGRAPRGDGVPAPHPCTGDAGAGLGASSRIPGSGQAPLAADGDAQHLERGVHPVQLVDHEDTPGRAMLPRAPQPAVGQPRTGTAGTGTRGSGAARTRPVLVSGTPAAQRLGRGCSRHPRQPGRDAEPLLAHAW